MSLEKIILYRGGSCNEQRVKAGLEKIVPEVYEITQHCDNYDMDPALAEVLFSMIHGKKADALFSVDYYPILAEAAHVAGIPYLSWIIDAPHYTLYSTTSFYDNVYIFHFDREEANRLIALGRPNVFHQPLATDVSFFSECIRNNRDVRQCDISFLGRSYQNEHDYFEKQDGLTEFEMGYCEGLMNTQHELYGVSIMERALSDEICDSLIHACDLKVPGTYDIPRKLMVASVLEKKLSVRERKNMVKKVAERFGIVLYSDTEKMVTKGVHYAGYADYETQMAASFHGSRINLNLTLRQIHSGIPLRALDIMGSGGFLLSNWQPELAENFKDGESLALFGSEEEMLEKTAWYLEHEDERKRIALKGNEIVKAVFGYDETLKSMIETVSGSKTMQNAGEVSNNHRISVIVPCYNCAESIMGTWRSLCAQTIGINELECIFVDDASTDNGATWCALLQIEKEAPESVVIIHLDENMHQGGARNVGISYATGKYLQFLDADDELEPEACKTLYDHAEKTNADVIMFNHLFCTAHEVRSSGVVSEDEVYDIRTKEDRIPFLNATLVTYGCTNKFYRMELIRKCRARFAEHVIYEEPLFVYPCFLYAGRVALLNKTLYRYILHQDSTVTSKLGRRLLDHPSVQLQLLAYCMEHEEIYKEYRDVIGLYFLWSYYCETLCFAAEHSDAILSLEYFRGMQDVCLKFVPDWRKNPEIQKVSEGVRRVLETMEKPVENEAQLWELVAAVCNKLS
ncbi:MAG: glycosyltransferase [Lachnospiraceae bacterium]|nr:glycosyltransferase [Lachnospiraceae bacterium]